MYLKTHIQIFMFMLRFSFLSVTYVFFIKWIALFKLIPEAAKFHSLQGKPSPDLPPTLSLMYSLYFSLDLLGVFSFFFFLPKCLIGYMSGYCDFSGTPLEALPFLTFCLKIQMTTLLTC